MTDSWHALTPETRRHLPIRIRKWVALETSMTARIGQVANSPIDVEVLRQTQAGFYPDERQLFAASCAPAVVREVCLSAAGMPLLVARTVFNSRKLQTHPTLVKLGNKALGSLLFAGPKPCRWTVREFAGITYGNPLFTLIQQRHQGLQRQYWGRRTLFWFFDEPLLVTETFLPELIHHPNAG